MALRLVALVVAVAVAIPVAAYIIVSWLVRSTVNEGLPVASAPASGALSSPAAAAQVVAQGELRRLNAVDFGSGKVLIADVNNYPANLDPTHLKSVVLYCRTFNVIITFALLAPADYPA